MPGEEAPWAWLSRARARASSGETRRLSRSSSTVGGAFTLS